MAVPHGAKCNASGCVLYATPELTAFQGASLPQGAAMTVVEERTGWRRVTGTVDGLPFSGWIMAAFLLEEPSLTPTQSTGPTPFPPPKTNIPPGRVISKLGKPKVKPSDPITSSASNRPTPGLLFQLGTVAVVTAPFWLALLLTRRST